jgi:hypothetical protein
MVWCLIKHGDNFTFTSLSGLVCATDNFSGDEEIIIDPEGSLLPVIKPSPESDKSNSFLDDFF